MTNYSELQPLALGAGWIIEKNKFLKTSKENKSLLSKNHTYENPLLVLKYKHNEQKRKFSFQNYMLFILVWNLEEYPESYLKGDLKEYFKGDNCTDKYFISVSVKPCKKETYLLDKEVCVDSQSAAGKIKYFAGKYSSPYNWKHQGIDEYYKPIDFISVRIPAGWNILLNSFREKDTFIFPVKQECNIRDFEWERDISAYKLELNECFIYVELQEYINKNTTNSLLHIYVYYDLKNKNVFFEKLESIFCYSLEKAKKELEEMLWKWKLSQKAQIEKEAGKFYNAEEGFEQ